MLYLAVYMLRVAYLAVDVLAEDYSWSVPDLNHPYGIKTSQIPKRDSLFYTYSNTSPELVLNSERENSPHVSQMQAKSVRRLIEDGQPLRLKKVCRHPVGCQKRPGGLPSLLELSASDIQLSLLDSYDKQVNHETESKLVTGDFETTTPLAANLMTFGSKIVKEPLQIDRLREESVLLKRPSTTVVINHPTLQTPTEPSFKKSLHSNFLRWKQQVTTPEIEFTTVPVTTKQQEEDYKTSVAPKTVLKSNSSHNVMKNMHLIKNNPGNRRKMTPFIRTTTTTTTEVPSPEYIYEYEEVEEDEEEHFSTPDVPRPTLLDVSGIFPDENFESETETHIFSDDENKTAKVQSELATVDDLLDTTTIGFIPDSTEHATLRALSMKETIRKEMKERRQNLFSRRKPVNILTTITPPSDTTVIPPLKILQQKVAERVKPKMKSQDISSAATFQIKTRVPFANKLSNRTRTSPRNRYSVPLKEATSTSNINLRKVPLKSQESRMKLTGMPKRASSLIPLEQYLASASELKPTILTQKPIEVENFQETIEESLAPNEESTQFTIPTEGEKHTIPSTTEQIPTSRNIERSTYVPRFFKTTKSLFSTEPTTSRKKFVPKHFPKSFFDSTRMPEGRTSYQSTVRPQFSTIRNIFKVKSDRLNSLSRLRSPIATTQAHTTSEDPLFTTINSIEPNETSENRSEPIFFGDEESQESLTTQLASTELFTEEISLSRVAETVELLPLEAEMAQSEDNATIRETTLIPPFDKITQSILTNMDLDQTLDKPVDVQQIRERTNTTSTVKPNDEVTPMIDMNQFLETDKSDVKTEPAIISESFTEPKMTEIAKVLLEDLNLPLNTRTSYDEVDSKTPQNVDSNSVILTSSVHDFPTSTTTSITPPTPIKVVTSIVTSKSERKVFFNRRQLLEAEKNFISLIKQNRTLPSKPKGKSIAAPAENSSKNSEILLNSTFSYDSDRTPTKLNNSIIHRVSSSTSPKSTIQTENNRSPNAISTVTSRHNQGDFVQYLKKSQVFSDPPNLSSLDSKNLNMNTHGNDETDPMMANSELVIQIVEMKDNEKLQRKPDKIKKEGQDKVIPKYKFPPNDAVSFYATSTAKSLFKDNKIPVLLSNIRHRSNRTNEPVKIYSSYTNVLLQ
ncbi:hypothetical protein QYM36_007528 [Artemia franciscana]|uniref:Uncharacterized protein n=1 Tax=Artemia franciscana TaxID=6661 RepID=A0AA88IU18_ARTSF|nr:hypothetical protein QYM36_007528 [Artemia franciscana]